VHLVKGGQIIEANAPCAACKGKGQIKVLAPPMVCPRCGGSGHSSQVGLFFNPMLCVICRGTGWLMTELHIASNPE
jgi:DnaJ-class molecular chaperone